MMDDCTLLPATPLSVDERNGVYRAIFTRRDTRGQFLPDAVPDEMLSRLLVAAHHAPSVGYMQPWSFLIIRNVGVKRQVHDAFLKAHAEAALMFPEEKRDFYSKLKLEGIMEAPINICVTCDRDLQFLQRHPLLVDALGIARVAAANDLIDEATPCRKIVEVARRAQQQGVGERPLEMATRQPWKVMYPLREVIGHDTAPEAPSYARIASGARPTRSPHRE